MGVELIEPIDGNYDTVPSGRALIVQVDDRSMPSPAN